MCCDESIEDFIIEYTQACLVISKMMIRWFIVIVEDQSATTCNNPLGWLSDRQTIDLIQITIKCLYRRECSHIPHSYHARYICRNNLICSWNPFDSDQAMVMALEQEDFLLNMRVPDENVMVEAGAQN